MMQKALTPVDFNDLVWNFLNQLTVKAISQYSPNFIEKLNNDAGKIDALSTYFLVDNCPQLFMFLSGNYSYMHYTDFKYSTLDSAFPKT